MTETTTETKPAVTLQVFAGILTALEAIDLATAESPQGARKCADCWQEAGPASDSLKRLFAYGATLQKELYEEEREAASKHRLDLAAILSSDAPPTQEQIEELNAAAATARGATKEKKHLISLVGMLIRHEAEREFPALVGKQEVFFDENWVVGWNDHTEFDLEELLGSGIIIRGSSDPEGASGALGLGDLLAGIFGRRKGH